MLNEIETNPECKTFVSADEAMKELGLNEVRIMNLYSEVFDRKPTTSQLTYDKENFEYITQAVNTAGEYKLIIAYGSSHSSNKTTNTLKKNLLEAISNSKAKDRVYQISSVRISDKFSGEILKK